MPRRMRFWLAVGLAAGVLAWASWPGAPRNPATLINRVDLVAVVLIMVGMPWPLGRLFGPMRDGWLPRTLRVGGYAAVFALMLVKANVLRHELARLPGLPEVDGLWLGEIVFLLVLATYIAVLLAVTAKRTPAKPVATAFGTGAGVGLGLAIYLMRPLANPLHTTSGWITGLYVLTRVLSVPLILGSAIAVGVLAARRVKHRDGKLPLADTRARQGVATGLCAGMTAALIVSVLGATTIALAPHEAMSLEWTLPGRLIDSGTLYGFDVSVTDAAAGFLLVLIIFPILGAGLGAWGGLYAAGRPGNGPGDNGGGGGGGKDPEAPPRPLGGLQRGYDSQQVAVDIRQLLDSPPWEVQPVAPRKGSEEPDRRELTPAGGQAAGDQAAGGQAPSAQKQGLTWNYQFFMYCAGKHAQKGEGRATSFPYGL
jgi:hypothetical protein